MIKIVWMKCAIWELANLLWFKKISFLCEMDESSSRFWVYVGVRTCEVFLCFVAIVRARAHYVDFFVFFVLRYW